MIVFITIVSAGIIGLTMFFTRVIQSLEIKLEEARREILEARQYARDMHYSALDRVREAETNIRTLRHQVTALEENINNRNTDLFNMIINHWDEL